MITPTFKLDQNENYLFVNIKAPYAKLNEVDLSVDENDFRFYCKPYYLRLNLPGKIIDNESDHGSYDFDQSMFKFKFEKQTKGENFDGLDLLTKLLTPNNSNSSKTTAPLIQEISTETSENQNEEEDEEDEDEWFIEQNINQEDDEDIQLSNGQIKYGFAQTKSNIFAKLSEEYTMVIDLPDPDKTPVEDRRKLRILNEDEKFNSDHYLADFFDDTEMIETCILKYYPMENSDSGDDYDYTEKEFDCLKSLPKRTYLLDKLEKFYAYSGMIDILYAYCYNDRINCGDSNAESGWTIAKMSSTLSWFDTFKSLEDCLVACFRRSLSLPLYRNWKISKAVYKDLIKLLKKGRKQIIKTFLKIRETFIDGDCRYILNDLYINDYLVWLQYISEDKLKNLTKCIEKIKITKEMMDFDLECIELSGKLALEDPNFQESDDEDTSKSISTSNNQTDNLVSQLDLLNLQENTSTKQKPKIIELN